MQKVSTPPAPISPPVLEIPAGRNPVHRRRPAARHHRGGPAQQPQQDPRRSRWPSRPQFAYGRTAVLADPRPPSTRTNSSVPPGPLGGHRPSCPRVSRIETKAASSELRGVGWPWRRSSSKARTARSRSTRPASPAASLRSTGDVEVGRLRGPRGDQHPQRGDIRITEATRGTVVLPHAVRRHLDRRCRWRLGRTGRRHRLRARISKRRKEQRPTVETRHPCQHVPRRQSPARSL